MMRNRIPGSPRIGGARRPRRRRSPRPTRHRRGQGRVAEATAKAGTWDGPTTGPTAAPSKTIVYVAGDLRNGGTPGVADGVKEAAKAIGWELRVIDGQGDGLGPHGRAQPGDRAQARRHHRRRLRRDRAERRARAGQGGRDPVRRLARDDRAGPGSGDRHVRQRQHPHRRCGQDRGRSRRSSIPDGKAGVVIFGDSNYAMAIGKAQMMEAEIEKCAGCKVLSLEDSPMAEASMRMPQLTTSLLQRFGDKWTYSLAVNDLYYDFMGPSLVSAGKSGDRRAPQHLGRRRIGIGLPAHPRQAVPDGHRARAAA